MCGGVQCGLSMEWYDVSSIGASVYRCGSPCLPMEDEGVLLYDTLTLYLEGGFH